MAEASGGLAPARCPGLVMSLRSPRLAALGAGLVDDTTAAAARRVAAAGEVLRAAQDRARARGGWRVRATWSRTDQQCVASGTLVPGGAASGRGHRQCARRRRTRRRPPKYAQRSAYEGAHRLAWKAFEGVAAVARRMARQFQVDYDLVYLVMRLAPSFGRTRGILRGAGGYRLEWPASRTRASLAQAEEAAEAAHHALRMSELSLRQLGLEHERMRRYAKAAEEQLAALKRMRTDDVASCGGVAGSDEERGREKVVAVVAEGVATATAELARAQGMLDMLHWGVWGSARRCRASTRELEALRRALREAERDDWCEDLPGGSAWEAAVAAAGEDSAQLGGGGPGIPLGGSSVDSAACGDGERHAGDHDGLACGPLSNENGGAVDVGCNEQDARDRLHGRQAADGGCDSCGWRTRLGGTSWGQRPESEDSREDAWRHWRVAWEQAMMEQRGKGRQEGEVEGVAVCVGTMSVRTRLWLTRKHRRRRRLQVACGAPRA
eukprot:SAG11_NODE_5199_length_1632_cov_47.477495_2_plen_494_part_01